MMSTALMRAFERRADTMVVDEPFYGFYLAKTNASRPVGKEIMSSMSTDWREIVDSLCFGHARGETTIIFQKHMTHHLLNEVDRKPLQRLRNAYLIRHPRLQVMSYARLRSDPSFDDLGWRQQLELFRRLPGPVIDASDILREPRTAVTNLCDALDIPFDVRMLSWPRGRRQTDGVWASHWYSDVERSTGFGPYLNPESVEVRPDLSKLVRRCMPFYEAMSGHKLNCVSSS